MITYRGEKGTSLTIAEIDNNFAELDAKIESKLGGAGNKDFVTSADLDNTIEYINNKVSQKIEVGVERLIGEFVWGGVTYDHYEKIVDFGALPNNEQKTLEHGIENIHRIVKVYGEACSSSNNISIPFVNANATLFIYLGVGNTKITITTNSDRSNFNALIYIEFLREKE